MVAESYALYYLSRAVSGTHGEREEREEKERMCFAQVMLYSELVLFHCCSSVGTFYLLDQRSRGAVTFIPIWKEIR